MTPHPRSSCDPMPGDPLCGCVPSSPPPLHSTRACDPHGTSTQEELDRPTCIYFGILGPGIEGSILLAAFLQNGSVLPLSGCMSPGDLPPTHRAGCTGRS